LGLGKTIRTKGVLKKALEAAVPGTNSSSAGFSFATDISNSTSKLKQIQHHKHKFDEQTFTNHEQQFPLSHKFDLIHNSLLPPESTT
jgi:hypothetical protein